jgi:hypothetical protein
MKKVVVVGIIIIAILSGWGMWLYQWNRDSYSIQLWRITVDNQNTTLKTKQSQIDSLNTQNEALTNANKKQEGDLAKSQELIDTLMNGKTEVDGKLATANKVIITLQSFKDRLMCSNAANYEIDMKSNSSASEGLKNYLGDTSETIKTADWKTIWSNSRTAIHSLYGKYLHSFIVSFIDKDDIGTANYVYDIQYNCYVVAPE